jgi:hypothetical protein
MFFKKALYFILLSKFLLATDPTSYGWNIPNTSLNIGGYIDSTYDKKREDAFMFNDIALLFSSHENHFDMLGEVEISHLTLDGKSNGSSDIEIILERLQLAYSLENEQMFTIGRFNSDIGYWNQAPINILQDSITKPHIVKNIFPKATTGLMYKKGFDDENQLSITLQHNRDVGNHDESIVVDRHLAMGYHGISSDRLSWRVSGGSFRKYSGEETYYFGVGTEYDGDLLTLQGELFTQQNHREFEIPYSGYLQSVWHLANRQDGMVRFEHYKDELLDVHEAIVLVGYAYRPSENIVLKGEYVYHSQLPLKSFVYSFSVIF